MKTLMTILLFATITSTGYCDHLSLRIKAYIVQQGGSVSESRYKLVNLYDSRGVHLERWDVPNLARPKLSDLPSREQSITIVGNAKKTRDSNYKNWDRQLDAIVSVMADELGITENEMKDKIKAKLRDD
tara:strand:- start:14 stop:400 length:387 start_codon:yes stop_codon:yes gene_type:complete